MQLGSGGYDDHCLVLNFGGDNENLCLICIYVITNMCTKLLFVPFM